MIGVNSEGARSGLARPPRPPLSVTAALSALLLSFMLSAALATSVAAEQASKPVAPEAGQLDSGRYHACAVLSSANVRCWGFSGDGQLGYGNTNAIGDDETPDGAGPVNLGVGQTAKALSAGNSHTCAVLNDNTVRCWGFGRDGRLGYGGEDNVANNPANTPDLVGPVSLGANRSAKAITAGGAHSCALLDDDTVRCWGYGSDGSLGYGNQSSVGTTPTTLPGTVGPVELGANRKAKAITAGGRHTCAILDDDSVRCWGFGANGQLGYGNISNVGDNETPASHALPGVACPLTTQCTAVDNVGQEVTFNPASPGSPTPTAVDAGNVLRAVACPTAIQCTAVDNAGRQVTFDPNSSGSPTPIVIDTGNALTAVACPTAIQCTAVDNAGQEVTFNPTASSTPTPTTIDAGTGNGAALTAVACPSAIQCTAVDNAGRQVTFNPNSSGSPTPIVIDTGNALTAVACPTAIQCTAVDNDGRQVTFNPTMPGSPTPTTIDAGAGNGNALTGIACRSTVQCTAVDNMGQQVTFNPTAPAMATLTTIDAGRALTAVECSSATQCTAVGSVGQQVTFNPTTPSSPTPTTIDTGHALFGLACRTTTQCTAVGNAGQQVTFDPTAPGSPTRTIFDTAAPVYLGAGRTAKAISAGDFHTCALLDDNTVRCWGYGGNGRLGNGSAQSIGDTDPPGSHPTVGLGGHTAKAISAGQDHTCALLDDGTVRCWGVGANGRLGYADTNDIANPGAVGPVDLGPGRSAVAISAGGRGTCARLDDGSVRCWGYGGNGRLGYCNSNNIGDDETPGSAGPVKLEPGGAGAVCAPVGAGPPSAAASGAAPPPGAGTVPTAGADAARARGLSSCLAGVTRHAKGEQRLARRRTGRRRAKIRRHLSAHARSGRRRCLRVFARTPGPISGLRARPIGRTQVELAFAAPGTDGKHAPPARSYVVKQSRRPIRSARDFSRARALCKGVCRFTVTAVGGRVRLTVTDLRPRTTYYYAVSARDNVSSRRGPRSAPVRVRTR